MVNLFNIINISILPQSMFVPLVKQCLLLTWLWISELWIEKIPLQKVYHISYIYIMALIDI